MPIFVEKRAIREILFEMEESLVTHEEGFRRLNELVEEDKSVINPIDLFYLLQVGMIEKDFHKYAEGLELVVKTKKYSSEVSVRLQALTREGIRAMSRACRKILEEVADDDEVD